LSFRTTEMSLIFRQCNISIGLNLTAFNCQGLHFDQTVSGSINASGIVVDGQFRCDGLRLFGLLHLPNAKINSDFTIYQSKIEARGIVALHASGLDVGGAVTLDDSSFIGRLNFIGAKVGRDLIIENGQIDAGPGVSFFGDNIKISGRCFIRNGMKIRGTVRLFSATIAGELDLGSTEIKDVEEFAFDARNAHIGGTAYISNGFKADGRVSLYVTDIAGELVLSGATIRPTQNIALDFQGSKIHGTVRLDGQFNAGGAVLFYGANIDGDLSCQGARVSTSYTFAFDGRRSSIKGAVFMTENFFANNLVSFYGASVGGDLVLMKAEIAAGRALEISAISAANLRMAQAHVGGGVEAAGAHFSGRVIIENSQIGGGVNHAFHAPNLRAQSMAVYGDKTEITGTILLYGATILGDLEIKDCTLIPRGNQQSALVFNAASSHCNGTLRWRPSRAPLGSVNLENAHVGALDDDLDKWPATLKLDGFTYDGLVGNVAQDVAARLAWLKRQSEYHSQPFEQLIAIYRKLGDSGRAAEVAISKWRRRRENLTGWARAWDIFLDLSSGYGYRPWRPLLAIVVTIALGIAVYQWGEYRHVFCPADSLKPETRNAELCATSTAYPRFNPVLYSLESLLPIADFGQRRMYVVRADNAASFWVNLYTVFHRFSGWIFGLLLALAPTNVLKRE
jgi:sRNA-binding regulator protein Hfq